MLDSMAERYGVLPSEILRRADTLDITVMTAAIAYRNEQMEKANDPNYVPKSKEPSQAEMLAMLERVRAKQGVKQ
jgi:hypothetical protein